MQIILYYYIVGLLYNCQEQVSCECMRMPPFTYEKMCGKCVTNKDDVVSGKHNQFVCLGTPHGRLTLKFYHSKDFPNIRRFCYDSILFSNSPYSMK